jgi:Na+-driven multidrug efflux pump
MQIFLAVIAGSFIGVIAGYSVGAFVACTWLYPTSNLCGIYGVFYIAPVGLVCGALGGWLWSRRKKDRV